MSWVGSIGLGLSIANLIYTYTEKQSLMVCMLFLVLFLAFGFPQISSNNKKEFYSVYIFDDDKIYWTSSYFVSNYKEAMATAIDEFLKNPPESYDPIDETLNGTIYVVEGNNNVKLLELTRPKISDVKESAS